MAGRVGVLPWTLTFGELREMDEADYDKQAWFSARIASSFSGKIDHRMFNPYYLAKHAEKIAAQGKAVWRATGAGAKNTRTVSTRKADDGRK